jgi:protoporphyrinogen/coproporphyrinogen III oxidase
MMHHTWRVAVVGGGLSGLAAAHRIGELSQSQKLAVELSVFEASARTGGVMGTERIGEYLVETGADSFITNKPWAVDLCRRLGIADRLIPTEETYRGALVLRNGKPVPVPEGFQLLSPAKIWPVLTSPLFSWRGKLRMGMEYFLPRRKSEGDESLADFVRRRFGQQALERLVQPLVGGIYTSDPEKLSLKATMPQFVEMEREHRSLIRASRLKSRNKSRRETRAEQSASGARYSLFATPQDGISELLGALSERIQANAKICLNSPVQSLQRQFDLTWRLRFGDGTNQVFDALVLAIPAYRAAELLNQTDARLGELLGGIEYASTAIVVSGHKLSDIRHPLTAFGLVIPALERRRILAVSFTSRKFPGRAPAGCVQLRTFVGGAMQPELLDRSDEEIIQLVREELRELLGVTGEPDFVRIARWNRAMPQYHLGHLKRVEEIESRIRQYPGLALAGNAYRGVGLPDCIHSGEQAGETTIQSLGFVPRGEP